MKSDRSRRIPSARGTSATARTAALAARTAPAGQRRDLRREVQGGRECLLGRHDLRDETEGSGFVGPDRPSGQHELHGPRGADRPGQPLGAAAAGDDPELDLGLPEDRVAPRDDHVARHGELAATSQRVAPHGRDRGRRHGRHAVPAAEPLGGGERRRRLLRELADVRAGGEGARSGPRDHDGPDVRVRVERLHDPAQVREEREAQGVERPGPGQRDERDPLERRGRPPRIRDPAGVRGNATWTRSVPGWRVESSASIMRHAPAGTGDPRRSRRWPAIPAGPGTVSTPRGHPVEAAARTAPTGRTGGWPAAGPLGADRPISAAGCRADVRRPRRPGPRRPPRWTSRRRHRSR